MVSHLEETNEFLRDFVEGSNGRNKENASMVEIVKIPALQYSCSGIYSDTGFFLSYMYNENEEGRVSSEWAFQLKNQWTVSNSYPNSNGPEVPHPHIASTQILGENMGSLGDGRNSFGSLEEHLPQKRHISGSMWTVPPCSALSQHMPTIPLTMGSSVDRINSLAFLEDVFLEEDVSESISWTIPSCSEPAPSQLMPTVPRTMGSLDGLRNLLPSLEESFSAGRAFGFINRTVPSCSYPVSSQTMSTVPHTTGSSDDLRNLLAIEEEPFWAGHVSESINLPVPSCFDPASSQSMSTILHTMPPNLRMMSLLTEMQDTISMFFVQRNISLPIFPLLNQLNFVARHPDQRGEKNTSTACEVPSHNVETGMEIEPVGQNQEANVFRRDFTEGPTALNTENGLMIGIVKTPPFHDSYPGNYPIDYKESENAGSSSEWASQVNDQSTLSTPYQNHNALVFPQPQITTMLSENRGGSIDWRNSLASQAEHFSDTHISGSLWRPPDQLEGQTMQFTAHPNRNAQIASSQVPSANQDRRNSLASQVEAFFMGRVSESSNLAFPEYSDTAAPSQPVAPILKERQDTWSVKVKVTYGDSIIKFLLLLTSGIKELMQEVSLTLDCVLVSKQRNTPTACETPSHNVQIGMEGELFGQNEVASVFRRDFMGGPIALNTESGLIMVSRPPDQHGERNTSTACGTPSRNVETGMEVEPVGQNQEANVFHQDFMYGPIALNTDGLRFPECSDAVAPSQPMATILDTIPHLNGGSSECAFQVKNQSTQFTANPYPNGLVDPHPQIALTQILSEDMESSFMF
ncbi:hypothetical protein RHSIM_Rhsim05G0025500 [Rhododendron simsii]|uniref:Uncharacterized protein n=1 Tax=Rhododendron simsii TaxID=118357 RepID=A0A834HA41_RHOSS|nr:hypothetical protein RHSIM_Rhsim05G0025500 [Rhododendron simsii]